MDLNSLTHRGGAVRGVLHKITQMATFRWTQKTDEAAFLVAQDDLTEEQIAGKLSVSRSTVAKWKANSEFRARVDEHVKAFMEAIRRHGIGRVENRVRRLDRDWRLLQKIVEERGETADVDVPGMGTGHIVHQVKAIGKGEDFEKIDVYMVDTGLLAELRAIEQQAAKELGQWTDKQDLTTDGQPIKILSGVSMKDL